MPVPVEIQELIRAAHPVPEVIVEIVPGGRGAKIPCEGNQKVRARFALAMHDIYHPGVDEFDDVEATFAVINDNDLGNGVHIVKAGQSGREVARELLHQMCVAAGCKHGAICVKKQNT